MQCNETKAPARGYGGGRDGLFGGLRIARFYRSPRFRDPSMPDAKPTGLFARRPLRRALRHWRERHQHPFNFAIHLVGIPLAVAGVVLLFVLPWEEWYWGAGAFVFGYVLQWLGHVVEGNDVGEWAG